MKESLQKILLWFKTNLVGINDSPHKIAAGFGLGIFTGILPGMGPMASVVLAVFFKVNRAAALVGSVLTNTWLSFVTFVLSVQIGASLLGKNWQELGEQYRDLLHDFHWRDLGSTVFLQALLPVLLGYVVVGVGAGLIGYGICWLVLKVHRDSRVQL